MLKKMFIAVLSMSCIYCATLIAEEKNVIDVQVYPPLIYDSGKCPIYKRHLSKVMFLFYRLGPQAIDDFGKTTVLELDLPQNLELKQAAIMNGWKKSGPVQAEFHGSPIVVDNKPYLRYTLKCPDRIMSRALKMPLRGGMYGTPGNGTPSQNLVNIFVKPKGLLLDNMRVYWRTKGAFNASGSFPLQLIELPGNNDKPKRIIMRSLAPLAMMGNPPEAVTALSQVFKKIGVDWVQTQFNSGPNKGYRSIWEKAGFKFYGGDSLLHTTRKYSLADRTASKNINDYLVGLQGKRAYGSHAARYYGHIWCPQALVTEGRFPYNVNVEAVRNEAADGASAMDIDFEMMTWSHCFCPVCLKAFAAFSKIPLTELEKLKPLMLVKTYPLQWYKFRCEQTSQLYARLRDYLHKHFPGVKMGCNALLVNPENDLGDLKYGLCACAEDPRLLEDSVDYFLCDTLTGSVYDTIAVDIMHKTTNKPIISVPGNSYCVHFGPYYNAPRRRTAQLLNCQYGGEGYERRSDLLKLGMISHVASGASGLRFNVDDAEQARKVAEGARILALTEDLYLDGKRADDSVDVIDLTRGQSPWERDKSKIGPIWLYIYKKYHAQAQYRVHLKNGDILVSLFNWDYYQDKQWLVRLRGEYDSDYYVTNLLTGKMVVTENKQKWSAAELRKGLPVSVPSAGMTLLLFSQKPPKGEDTKVISAEDIAYAINQAKTKKPHNQYGWYKGGKIDFKKYLDREIIRHINNVEKYGFIKEWPAAK